MTAKLYGREEPRLFTPPLRELTPETSRGFDVILFAKVVLGVELRPWQRWLLIHALELKEDGTYRFKKVIVLVARQNGKTLLAAVLACYWLFIESERDPKAVNPIDFKVVGIAQNIDIAREPWNKVKLWCDPEPEDEGAAANAIPALQELTTKVLDANGKEQILLRNGAHYQVRAAEGSRGKPAARALVDEFREQENFRAWAAISQTAKSFSDGQIYAFSNAGTAKSVALAKQRDYGLGLIESANKFLEAGSTLTEWAKVEDPSFALFEWSAPEECGKEDVEAILQANPSIGWGNITVEACISDARSMPDAEYRTEVLCQWVTAKVNSYIQVNDWNDLKVPVKNLKGRIKKGERTVWGVDTSGDRTATYVATATRTVDGDPFVNVRHRRAGMLWLPDWLTEQAEESGNWEVALQTKGCPSMEFAPLLEERGFQVIGVDGGHIGIATGRFRDRVRDGELVIVEQPMVDLGIEGGITRKYAENEAWDRHRSLTDVAPVIAETVALYGLEVGGGEAPQQSAYATHDFVAL